MAKDEDEVGDLIADLFDDVGKVNKLLRRAFPGTDADDEEVRARRDKYKRASAEPGLERIHDEQLEPTESEREAARIQEEARGKHTIYAITARHHRHKPFDSDWVGHCQAVRVTLAPTRAEAEPIWTHLGVVKGEDHLAFSVEELVAGYSAHFGRRPTVERVDLVTGARHYDLDRFSPISVFLAFEKAEDEVPSFYVYESGSADGKPQKLYWGERLDSTIIAEAGFQFTPFARETNTYKGRLIMNRAKTEPSMVTIAISLDKAGKRHAFTLTASYEVVPPAEVIWPVAVQIQAALRVFAIAQGMGCDLELWEWGLGQMARSAFDWIAEPPQRGKPSGYSGCSS